MSTRATARHRSDSSAITPLTALAESVTGGLQLATAVSGRNGAALAVTTGLVATMGLPAASADTASAPDRAVTAGIALAPLAQNVSAEVATGQVSAAATADVRFERPAFVPTLADGHRANNGHTTLHAAAAIAQTSRSLARAALKEQEAKQQAAVRRAAEVRASQTASRSNDRTQSAPAPVANGNRGASVIAIASRYLGVPYVYGGTTPRGFDCSGFSQYVYAQLGIRLPRTAQQQYNFATRIARSQAKPGDLVFFFSGGGVGHMGIYLGGNMMIAAPRTGQVVRKQPIYSANVAFGRVS